MRTIWVIAYLLDGRFILAGGTTAFNTEAEAWDFLNTYRSTFNAKGTPMPTSLYLKE